MRFLSNIEAKIDIKGRINVPARYRKELEKEEENTLILRVDKAHRCLKVYPQKVWEQKDEQVRAKLNLWNESDLRLYRQFTSGVDMVELDASGRILLQQKYADAIGVKTDALFAGISDFFEIWNPETYEASLADDSDFAQLLQEKMGGTPNDNPSL